MIKWEQMVFLGNPEYAVDLSPVDFVKVAEACGARGVRIEDPGTCRQQLEEALAMDGPVLIEAVVDPYEAPMPPMVQPKQAKLMTEALAKGEPNRERIALTLFRDVVEEAGYSSSPSGIPGRIREAVTGALGQDEDSKKS